MGYFQRPIRRSVAREAKLEHAEQSRLLDPRLWKHCDRAIEFDSRDYLRFAIEHPTEGRTGLFRSSELLEEDIELSSGARSEFRAILRWFNKNLAVPRRLPRNAICWFRADADEFIARARNLIELYRMIDVSVLMQSTRHPGRIVYRDTFQVAAVPHRDRHAKSTEL